MGSLLLLITPSLALLLSMAQVYASRILLRWPPIIDPRLFTPPPLPIPLRILCKQRGPMRGMEASVAESRRVHFRSPLWAFGQELREVIPGRVEVTAPPSFLADRKAVGGKGLVVAEPHERGGVRGPAIRMAEVGLEDLHGLDPLFA